MGREGCSDFTNCTDFLWFPVLLHWRPGQVEGRCSVRVSLLDEAVYRDGWTKALFEFVCMVGTLVVFGALWLPFLVRNETN